MTDARLAQIRAALVAAQTDLVALAASIGAAVPTPRSRQKKLIAHVQMLAAALDEIAAEVKTTHK